MKHLKYKRLLLKLSGEALAPGGKGTGFSVDNLKRYSSEIAEISRRGGEVAIVLGGGNILRGAQLKEVSRSTADRMGMLATVINSLALSEFLISEGLKVSIMSIISVPELAEPYNPLKARDYLSEGRVVILAGGTGNPYVTTDTASVIRALELETDIMLKATKVKGVYDSDPERNPNAKFFKELSYDQAIAMDLRFMDKVAMEIARENGLKIAVFSLLEEGNLIRVALGEDVGTIIHP